eukprot:INCI13420.1.p1 GENE.INCI13420.1~~INCI13420.1.p1  ORF type:complete len:1028 (-),score=190.74 INCI13420.1:60-2894(-)
MPVDSKRSSDSSDDDFTTALFVATSLHPSWGNSTASSQLAQTSTTIPSVGTTGRKTVATTTEHNQGANTVFPSTSISIDSESAGYSNEPYFTTAAFAAATAFSAQSSISTAASSSQAAQTPTTVEGVGTTGRKHVIAITTSVDATRSPGTRIALNSSTHRNNFGSTGSTTIPISTTVGASPRPESAGSTKAETQPSVTAANIVTAPTPNAIPTFPLTDAATSAAQSSDGDTEGTFTSASTQSLSTSEMAAKSEITTLSTSSSSSLPVTVSRGNLATSVLPSESRISSIGNVGYSGAVTSDPIIEKSSTDPHTGTHEFGSLTVPASVRARQSQGTGDAVSSGHAGSTTPLPLNGIGDADSDGLADMKDAFPFDPDNDVDSDNIPAELDSCANDFGNDADSDSVCGDIDFCPDDFENDADSDLLCQDRDICPYDPENDIDSDSICGTLDSCPSDPLNDADSDQLCTPEVDLSVAGIPDNSDPEDDDFITILAVVIALLLLIIVVVVVVVIARKKRKGKNKVLPSPTASTKGRLDGIVPDCRGDGVPAVSPHAKDFRAEFPSSPTSAVASGLSITDVEQSSTLERKAPSAASMGTPESSLVLDGDVPVNSLEKKVAARKARRAARKLARVKSASASDAPGPEHGHEVETPAPVLAINANTDEPVLEPKARRKAVRRKRTPKRLKTAKLADADVGADPELQILTAKKPVKKLSTRKTKTRGSKKTRAVALKAAASEVNTAARGNAEGVDDSAGDGSTRPKRRLRRRATVEAKPEKPITEGNWDGTEDDPIIDAPLVAKSRRASPRRRAKSATRLVARMAANDQSHEIAAGAPAIASGESEIVDSTKQSKRKKKKKKPKQSKDGATNDDNASQSKKKSKKKKSKKGKGSPADDDSQTPGTHPKSKPRRRVRQRKNAEPSNGPSADVVTQPDSTARETGSNSSGFTTMDI